MDCNCNNSSVAYSSGSRPITGNNSEAISLDGLEVISWPRPQ